MKKLFLVMLLITGSVYAQDDMRSISEEDGSIGTFKHESEDDLKESTIQEEEETSEDDIHVGDGWKDIGDGKETILETEHD